MLCGSQKMYRHPLSHYFVSLFTLSDHADLALFGGDCAHPILMDIPRPNWMIFVSIPGYMDQHDITSSWSKKNIYNTWLPCRFLAVSSPDFWGMAHDQGFVSMASSSWRSTRKTRAHRGGQDQDWKNGADTERLKKRSEVKLDHWLLPCTRCIRQDFHFVNEFSVD